MLVLVPPGVKPGDRFDAPPFTPDLNSKTLPKSAHKLVRMADGSVEWHDVT